MAEFTYLWTNECRVNMRNDDCVGEATDVAAGNVFRKRGIQVGDLVYIVTGDRPARQGLHEATETQHL
jgi:hypothetical protein